MAPPDALGVAGKTALVWGAGRGIGQAVVRMLLAHGARVALLDQATTDCEETLAGCSQGQAAIIEWGQVPGGLKGDVADADSSANDAVRACLDRFDALDILVNAHSVASKSGTVREPDRTEWQSLFCTNLETPLLLMSAAANAMIDQGRGGRIVSVSSSSASRAAGVGLAYGCSKAALEALTRIAAAQLAEHDINVNAVAPGVTLTPLQRGLRSEEDIVAAVSNGPTANLFGRVSEPQDVAAAIVFLCSSGARQITGQVIHTSAGTVV